MSWARMPTAIDFSNQDMKPGSPEWESVKVQVRKALEEYGCFEVLLDRVVELRNPIFEAMKELFDLPLQTKRLCVSDKPFTGYSISESELLERVSISDAHISGNIQQCLTTPLWPQGNASFSEAMVSYTELASGLEKTIKRMILEIFGLEKYLDELLDSTTYHLRILKYGRPNYKTGNEPTLGLSAHRDQNWITLLYQNETDGLEIQNKDGEWIRVKPSSNSLIVLIGESLGVWLNDRFRPSYHRVVLEENKIRYSIGLFGGLRGGYLIKVPNELVDDQNPMLFKPYDHGEFIKFIYAQLVQRDSHCGVRDYCSV